MALVRELERGTWLEESALPDDARHGVESLCGLLASCVADLVVCLSMFEQAQLESHAEAEARRDRGSWERKWSRESELTEELEAGLQRGTPDWFERSQEIREQVRRAVLREEWTREGGPETYRRRRVFIHAQSFVSTLAVLQRSVIAMTRFELDQGIGSKIEHAADELADALPGLKDVRDSVAHVDERVRGEAHGKKIETKPLSNGLVNAPAGGVMIIGSLNGGSYGGTIADGTYAEVEVGDAVTEIAQVTVQAIYDALPWVPGPRRFEPSN